MSTLSLFVQEQGQSGIREVIVAEGITAHDLHQALAAGGMQLAADAFVFLDEIDIPLDREGREPVGGLHHGHLVHVSRCRQIRVTVNYLDRQAHREFGASRRVRAVKEWAVKEFGLDHKDAAEHVLQVHGTTERPASDTPLHTLLRDDRCHLTFDLVPEKRVEG